MFIRQYVICTQLAWALTPPAVQDYIKHQNQQIHALKNQLDQLQQQLETLQGQLEKTSQTSKKPPSSDSPFTKSKHQRRQSSGKRGGPTGHCGKGPAWLSPTEVPLLEPGPCPCGHGNVVAVTPYSTHQVIALPALEMDITHFVL
jgi:transposase